MIAKARIGVVWGVPLVFAAGLTGCDLSQQKPETIDTAVVTRRVGGDTPAAASEGIDGKTASEGERSVRLFGPGVSRQRQTRI
jgi:hypothetical protein